MKAVVLLASLVVLVAIVSACGGAEESSDQPTAVQETSVEDEYFRQVGDAFQQAKEQMEALEISSEGSPIAREDLLTTFRVYYHGHLEVARSMRDKLQAIDSPAQFNEAHNAAIGAINELIAMVQNLSQLADGADPQTLPDSELVSGTLLIPYRVREACLGLQRLADGHDVIVDLSCEQSAVAESNGAECQTTASGVECCGVIPGPDSQGTASEGCWASGTVDFGGVTGRLSPMPPLPSSLAAVSDYLVFEINENVPALSGLALPIREESPDLALIGFYTYDGVEWRRVAAVKMIRAGRAEGEFSSLPANVAVLREVR